MTIHGDIENRIPPGPCDDCALASRCAAERLACQAFKRYTKLQSWHNAPRVPSHALFKAVFWPRQVSPAALVRLARRRSGRGTKVTEAIAC